MMLKSELAEAKERIIAQYRRDTGVDSFSSIEAIKKFAGWMNLNDAELESLLLSRVLRKNNKLYTSYASKISLIAQRHCHVCDGGFENEMLCPISVVPIRITPRSRQAMKPEIFKAFQAAFQHRFSEQPIDLGGAKHFCIAVTYILNEKTQDRDLDNMTKALMDAFSRALNFNDKDIHHLDVLKILLPDAEEWLYLRIAPSFLNVHSDVVAPTMHHSFAGMKVLDLDDFFKD